MASKFIFGSPAAGGHSLKKLIVYFDDNSHQTPYSFDGRHSLKGSLKIYDHPKYRCAENAVRYLKRYFREHYQHRSDLKNAMIVDSLYPAVQIRDFAWCITTQSWMDPSVLSAQKHAAHRERIQTYDLYSMRLSVPMFPTKTGTKWVNFYSNQSNVGESISDLIATFNSFVLKNPQIKLQPIGQFFGKKAGQYAREEREIPRFCWFDARNRLPKYHGTQRVVAEYQERIEMHQNFEEMISNI